MCLAQLRGRYGLQGLKWEPGPTASDLLSGPEPGTPQRLCLGT